LTVVFEKAIQCSSVAPDGSDFKLTGPSGVSITSATCGGNTVSIQLSGPIYVGGMNQLELVTGDDGNTLIDVCNQQLPPGQTITFATGDTVHAQIQDQVKLGCNIDTIEYMGPVGEGINVWDWTFDSTQLQSGQNQRVIYTSAKFGTETAVLTVSNGFCSESTEVSIVLNNSLKAVFEATNLLCPKDKAYFSDSSVGPIASYNWIFGDGTGSNLAVPPPKQYPDLPEDKNYNVQLIIGDGAGCFDTASQVIQSIANCFIAVPSAFTPNGDGINDYLYPLNAYKAVNLEFRVYNRYGQLVFQTTNWTIRWDGNMNGVPQPVGTYVWTLRYTNSDTGQKVFQKGTSVLIR
jgi:gliding motility-associated-like protein